ncbi:hybrid sensor histidine kinase/response regulator [Cylindrospermum sp. FACHB-282]|uniref:hybrid sensor histidine kinase/response regulator n=1 Tax=Cylindrospermum sp. FACHB-282 TaxID=2692794 RepID=UPI001682FDDE|nr:PAS domain S-box protein [Cylindrospermum sp. FACHB-282]MBD2386586.1 PAS domain S-box protein [Cylindrospermum sp. FACHB-282]
MKGIPPRLKLYAVAVLAVCSALLLTLLLEPLLNPTIFILFFAAVAVSAWYGGMEAGMLATALSTLVVNYFFIEPKLSFSFYDPDSIVRSGLFILVTILISSLNSQLRTAKQRLELSMQRLEASEARFRRLAESNIIGVITADVNGGIVEANDAFLTMVGYTREELLAGRVRWCDMTPPEYLEVRENRSITELNSKGVCQPFEKEYIRKDGSRIPLLAGSALLENNPDQLIGFVLDLSNRKQAENALYESQSRFRALADATIEGVIIHEKGKVLDANPAFAKMFGYEIDEVIGMSTVDFLTPEAQKTFQKNICNHGDEKPYEMTGVKKDGTTFFLEIVGKSCIYQGRSVRVAAARNITERKKAETAFQDSEKRFRRLVESNIFGAAVSDFYGGIDYANDYFLNMVGYTREEMLAGEVRWDVMTPPEYIDLDQKAIEELLKHGVATPFEKEYIRKDGSRVPILIGIVLLQEPYNCQQEQMAFVLDLSERKRAEKTLHQREEELRLITNAVPVLISYIDAQHCYRFNNKGYEELFGLTASETYGKHIREVLGESVYQFIQPYIEAVMSGERVTFENNIFDKNGTSHDVSTTYIPQFSQHGQVEGFVALVRDITEQKQAEAALKQSEERLRKLTEKVRVIPWEANPNSGNFTYVGPQTVEILGYPSTDWYTDNFWAAHIHPEDREWAVKYCVDCSQSVNNYEFEYRMLAADGRVVWLYDIVNVVQGEHGPQLLHGFMIDISDRKQAEQEREQLLEREQIARAEAETLNCIKDEFLGTLSHELRTPLNAMLGWTQLLKSRKFDETTTAKALETIDRNSRALSQLIDDVLDVSGIIRGELGLNLHQVELIPVVEAAIDTIRPAADAKEICLECRFDSAVGVVMGDAKRLQQVVWNLLANAVKFTPKGGKVVVQLERIDSGVQIRVSDNGGGISAEFLPHVFERFRQADSSTTRSHGGLGLGLAIVRHLVELHGGTVSVESPGIGQGATFIVNLPMKAVAVEESSTAKQIAPTASGEVTKNRLSILEGVRVLVVDDEVDTRNLLKTILGQYGAQVMTAASTREGLIALEQFHPQILVSDIGMPEEDGYALIRQLRALGEEQGGRIPAVALTAYARAEDRTQALLAGFQLHIPKPVNPTELAAVVANLAGRT